MTEKIHSILPDQVKTLRADFLSLKGKTRYISPEFSQLVDTIADFQHEEIAGKIIGILDQSTRFGFNLDFLEFGWRIFKPYFQDTDVAQLLAVLEKAYFADRGGILNREQIINFSVDAASGMQDLQLKQKQIAKIPALLAWCGGPELWKKYFHACLQFGVQPEIG